MTTSRLAAPGDGAQSGALQRQGASGSKTPGKAVNRRYSMGRRQSQRGRGVVAGAAAAGALAEIRDFAASLKGGNAEVSTRLGVSRALISRALSGTYPATPTKLLEAWARYRAAWLEPPAAYLVRIVRMGRVLVAGRYFSFAGMERLNGRPVVLRPAGEHAYIVHADQPGHPLQVIGLAVTWAEAQALRPANPNRTVHQGETT